MHVQSTNLLMFLQNLHIHPTHSAVQIARERFKLLSLIDSLLYSRLVQLPDHPPRFIAPPPMQLMSWYIFNHKRFSRCRENTEIEHFLNFYKDSIRMTLEGEVDEWYVYLTVQPCHAGKTIWDSNGWDNYIFLGCVRLKNAEKRVQLYASIWRSIWRRKWFIYKWLVIRTFNFTIVIRVH